MADEEIRTDESEVEGHGIKPDPEEGIKPVAEDEEPEVEGHGVKPTVTEGVKPTVTEGVKP